MKNKMRELCKTLKFSLKSGSSQEIYEKYYKGITNPLSINIDTETIEYNNIGIKTDRGTTSNFKDLESLVVLECVDRLLVKGYLPEFIILEKKFNVGRAGGVFLDIMVLNKKKSAYMMIECKTFGKEYESAKKKLLTNDNSEINNQLLSYFINDKDADILCLYSSQVFNKKVENQYSVIYTESLKKCNNAKEAFDIWDKKLFEFGVFDADIAPYECRDRLQRGQLSQLTEKDSGYIFNQFLEILRHNGISDKPNAFNKILNLFLCKIVDEDKPKNKDVEFYWSANTTYSSMQSTLESLYKKGMSQYLNIEITDYKETDIKKKLDIVLGTSNPNLVNEIVNAFKEIKCHKSSEFAFKEIYNEETFIANAKVVKEIVELLQKYQFRYGHKQQFLGTFFENLLSTSIKQEVGQFFTPVPIAKFMITSLPLQKALKDKAYQALNGKDVEKVIPSVIDYSCGSGHFLTEFMDLMQKVINDCDTSLFNESVSKKIRSQQGSEFDWANKCVYGVEKDYRLVKTTKISTFLNGDGDANIIHADGLTTFGDKNFKGLLEKPNQFDFVIANPPYAVSNFKAELTNTDFTGYKYLSDDSKEIECLFVERTAQLLRDGGYAAVILPTSIMGNGGIYEDARQNILKHFYIKGIAKMGKNTFMSTNVETIILFLEKRKIDDYKNASVLINQFEKDGVDFNFNGHINIVNEYAKKHEMSFDDYLSIFNSNPTEKAKKTDYYNSINQDSKKKKTKQGLSEQEKLINFMLTFGQPCIIINTGEKDEEKQFLGYEFSSRRGHEGIHEYEEGSMLYDVDDPLSDNEEKVNYLIREIFLNNIPKIPSCLNNNVKIIETADLVDFSAGNKFNINAKKEFSPSTYPSVKIEEIAFIQKGTAITSDKVVAGNIPVVAGGTKPACYGDKSNRTGPSISIAASGTAGYVSYWEDDIFASDCVTLQSKNKDIKLEYLAEYLMRNQEAIYTYKRGSSTPHVYAEDIRTFNIPLPPVIEQQNIINECKKISKETELKEQLIKDCEEKLNNLYNGIVGTKTTLGNSDLFTVGGGKRVPKEDRLTSTPTSHPYIRVKDFKENSVDDTKIKYVTNAVNDKIKKYIVDSEKDIYVSIAGTNGLVGTIPSSLNKANLTENAAFIRCLDSDKVNKMFIMNLLALPKYRAHMIEKATTANQPKLSLESIKNIQIILPGIEIQNKIALKATELLEEIADARKFIEEAREKKNEIIDKYLNK